MKPVGVIEGRMMPLDRASVDTDQIMPKQFLKRIERTGFGEFVFFDWRAEDDFVLNDPRYSGSNVMVTGPNFGSGSSREHAPWGLQQYGFEVIIAPSFADIFRNNCVKIGLLTVVLPAEVCKQLIELATQDPGGATARVDLPAQTVTSSIGEWRFDIDPFTKHLLVEGFDDIGLTLQHAEAITAFEAQRPSWMPMTLASENRRGFR
jgi:3-isopropylmalate/(R)-2-methylmalate dehydratase small subunit